MALHITGPADWVSRPRGRLQLDRQVQAGRADWKNVGEGVASNIIIIIIIIIMIMPKALAGSRCSCILVQSNLVQYSRNQNTQEVKKNAIYNLIKTSANVRQIWPSTQQRTVQYSPVQHSSIQ